MPDVVVCPSCGAEYFAHITTCHHCEIELVAPERLEEARMNLPKAGGQLVQIIEDGSYERVKALADGLETYGIEAKALKLSGNSCKSGAAYGIFVPETLAEAAMQAIHGIWKELFPETVESISSMDKMNDGLCPACGAVLTTMAIECPDCGLNLGGPAAGGDCGDKGCGGNC
ncbi:MAG: hypothetical protein HY884_07585 [Deltaproteobacteria bacterium]|nr:hypothetical protein [Deltaproteobacteria bacterium]